MSITQRKDRARSRATVPASPLPAARMWSPLSSIPPLTPGRACKPTLLTRPPGQDKWVGLHDCTALSLHHFHRTLDSNPPPHSFPQPRAGPFWTEPSLRKPGFISWVRAGHKTLSLLGNSTACAPALLPANTWIPTARGLSTAAGQSWVGMLTCSARPPLCSRPTSSAGADGLGPALHVAHTCPPCIPRRSWITSHSNIPSMYKILTLGRTERNSRPAPRAFLLDTIYQVSEVAGRTGENHALWYLPSNRRQRTAPALFAYKLHISSGPAALAPRTPISKLTIPVSQTESKLSTSASETNGKITLLPCDAFSRLCS